MVARVLEKLTRLQYNPTPTFRVQNVLGFQSSEFILKGFVFLCRHVGKVCTSPQFRLLSSNCQLNTPELFRLARWLVLPGQVSFSAVALHAADMAAMEVSDPRHPSHPKGCTKSCCVVAPGPDSAGEDEESCTPCQPAKLSVSALKARCAFLGILTVGFIERTDFEAALQDFATRTPPTRDANTQPAVSPLLYRLDESKLEAQGFVPAESVTPETIEHCLLAYRRADGCLALVRHIACGRDGKWACHRAAANGDASRECSQLEHRSTCDHIDALLRRKEGTHVKILSTTQATSANSVSDVETEYSLEADAGDTEDRAHGELGPDVDSQVARPANAAQSPDTVHEEDARDAPLEASQKRKRSC